MHSKYRINRIIKRGERVFAKELKELFETRRAELIQQLKRLDNRQKEGWGYRRILRKGYTVRAHRVRSHWATVPVKRR